MDTRQVTQENEQMYCEGKVSHSSGSNELMQAHAVASTPNLHLKGVVYVTTMYRCTVTHCRRVKNVTSEVRMPHP